MTHKEIDKIICRHFGTTIKAIHSKSHAEESTLPRCAAMLLCREVLAYKYYRIQEAYNKRSHATISNALKTARNMIATDLIFRACYNVAHREAMELLPQLTKAKQRYNLHYRLREKKVNIITKHKTVSILPDQEAVIRELQLSRLLSKHNYSIQYAIL